MSRKKNGSEPKMDRRVRRTRDALGDALIALIQEQPFEAITVQHVLDRARIGRSTFYAHYRDKNDLFVSDVEDFLENISRWASHNREASNRVAPARELFAHVADMRPLYTALQASNKLRDFMELLEGYLARSIEKRLEELPASRPIAHVQRTAMAHAFAGALLSLMSWWLDHSALASAEEMDALYHRIVWSGATTDHNAVSYPAATIRSSRRSGA